MPSNYANLPFRRRNIRNSEGNPIDNRGQDSNAPVGEYYRDLGPGILPDQSRLNTPDFKDVPQPIREQNPYDHLPYISEPHIIQQQNRDYIGAERVNTSAGARLFPLGWPLATVANQAVMLPFPRIARHLLLQNNAGIPCYFDFDSPASLGTGQVPAAGYITIDIPMLNTLSVFTTAALNINGATVGGLYIVAWG
jgi:hypothetical protein